MATGGDLLKRVPALLALFSIMSPALAGDGIPRRDGAAAQQTVTVNMAEYKYTPAEVRIKAGDTVKWVNNERRTSHSVLFPAENGLESTRMFPGESWERRFQVPGRYEYTCGPHPEMKGAVHVE